MSVTRRQLFAAGALAGFLPVIARKWKVFDLNVPDDGSPIILPDATVIDPASVPRLILDHKSGTPIRLATQNGHAEMTAIVTGWNYDVSRFVDYVGRDHGNRPVHIPGHMEVRLNVQMVSTGEVTL